MIKDFIIMKKNEWTVKAMLYSFIAIFIDKQKDIFELLQKIYISLKDIPAEELQKEIITKLTEIIYEENKTK